MSGPVILAGVAAFEFLAGWSHTGGALLAWAVVWLAIDRDRGGYA